MNIKESSRLFFVSQLLFLLLFFFVNHPIKYLFAILSLFSAIKLDGFDGMIKRSLQFFPLIIFGYCYKNGLSGEMTFIVGGIFGLLSLLVGLFTRRKMDTLFLSVNCFLIGGALMSYFHFSWLLKFYGMLRESSLYAWVVIVGIITTIFSSEGFINVKCEQKESTVKLYSLFFLIISVVVLLFSLYFKGGENYILSAALPFVILIFSKKYIQMHLKKVCSK
ncbi:hypothetical protein HN446_00035 [bacterium]|nr:hypothetical protein [bacterium]